MEHRTALLQQVGYQQISLDLVRRFDPLAVSPLVQDRTVYYALKRALDVVGAALALLLLAPVMLVVALLILLESGWPVIFAQARVGAQRWTREGFSYWRQANFTCYKFRSMVKNADASPHEAFVKAFICNDHERMAALNQENGEIAKLANDPRVTRVGRFLRKSSLDELPQLWNVLLGEMSLVGPRPPIPYEVADYSAWHQRRLRTKSGLTGLWQVTTRNYADYNQMVELDIQYVERQSLWLDLLILLRTPLAVFTGKGAA